MLASVLHFSTAFSAPEVELSKPTDVAKGDHWAVLIAGSSGYGNYRHQADVCHAYQIVKAQGIKPEQIIVLSTDDIANRSTHPIGNATQCTTSSSLLPSLEIKKPLKNVN